MNTLGKKIGKTAEWNKVEYAKSEEWMHMTNKTTDGYELQLYVPLLEKSIIVHQIPIGNTNFKPGQPGEWVITFVGGTPYYYSPKTSYKTPKQAQIAAQKEIIRAITSQLDIVKRAKP